jgi:hypothetical protein
MARITRKKELTIKREIYKTPYSAFFITVFIRAIRGQSLYKITRSNCNFSFPKFIKMASRKPVAFK